MKRVSGEEEMTQKKTEFTNYHKDEQNDAKVNVLDSSPQQKANSAKFKPQKVLQYTITDPQHK